MPKGGVPAPGWSREARRVPGPEDGPCAERAGARAPALCSEAIDPRRSLPDFALLRIDVAEVLHHFERPALGPCDVHVHAHVVLAGHHLGGAAGSLCDPGVIQSPDDVALVERAGLIDGCLPELQAPIHPRTRAPG